MDALSILQVIWYFIIGGLFLGYSLLDGFDLGIGVLSPFLAKDDGERKNLFGIIWPFWDGNEVWLVTGGAALFAAFPFAYATVFSGFYLALMLVLFALIFRAVSIEFWHYDEKRRRWWNGAFVVGSLVPSLLYGVALGNVVVGIPLNAATDFTGNFFTLLRPYPLVIGLLGLAAILMQGSTYAALKSEGAPRDRARGTAKKLGYLFMVMLVIAVIATATFLPTVLVRIAFWISVGIVALALVLSWINFTTRKNDRFSFLLSSLAFVGLWAAGGAVHFPNLVSASNDAALSLTLNNASSTGPTLKVMLGIAAIGMPVVIFYTAFVYRALRKKVGYN
jgi:cytochrome bd ubiquinol oxidase subunit II